MNSKSTSILVRDEPANHDQSFTPWKRAVEGTVVVLLVQFFIFYFQFMTTNCIPMTLVLLKTFLVAPVLLFLVNWAQFELLQQAECENSKKAAGRIVAASGLVKAMTITWSTTAFDLLRQPGGYKRLILVFLTFLIGLAAFYLVGYEAVMNMKEIYI